MSINRKGNLILFTGSSGVGKGTIIKELLDRDKNIRLSVSNTTREPREGEIDGVHYNFLTREQFNDILKKTAILNTQSFAVISTAHLKSRLKICSIRVMMFCLRLRSRADFRFLTNIPTFSSIFILPPSMESLERRLRREVQRMKKLFGKGLHRLPRKSATRTDISTMW